MWRLRSASDSNGNPFLWSNNNHKGRQIWEFDPNAGTTEERKRVEELRGQFTAKRHLQHHSADEFLRLQKSEKISMQKHKLPSIIPEDAMPKEKTAIHLRAAISFYECLQEDDGHFPGDYGGPMFLMPGLLITLYTTGVFDTVLSAEHKKEMRRYLRNHQNEDGGFGLHMEGTSTMFGTVLNYVAARLLGVGADDEMILKGRSWIHARGGAHFMTSWGKFWIAVLGVYSWDGLNPLNPEMWMLPYQNWTGIGYLHPGRFWCHCRMVYLPMSYIYGKRGTCKPTELTRAIREELYPVPYESIDWNKARNQCAKEDLYYPHPYVQDILWWALYKVEPWLVGSWVRQKALDECMKLIHYEDENTRYIDIGPVNKVINMLCCWFEDPDSIAFKKHIPRVYDYLWLAEDGMKMQGYNGSQLWDTSFAVQAFAAADMPDVTGGVLANAHKYIEASQVKEEASPPLARFYRHISLGAWPFSTADHGWPISDCSSEGLKAALTLAMLPPEIVGAAIPKERFFQCVNVLLSYQNTDGGMATYENTRSFHWLEMLNPSETFGDIVVDYSYVECTSACITALIMFNKMYPGHRREEIRNALARAEQFIRSIQRADGSWYGSWGVCFTYGCWFGAAALEALGYDMSTDNAMQRCCGFIASHQREDGGWGESYLSCQDKVYSQLEGPSHVVNTAWAMLTLISGGYHKHVSSEPLHRGAQLLMRMQLPTGDWPQQHISGVFNRNCMITYANYRNIFPIWALALYRKHVL